MIRIESRRFAHSSQIELVNAAVVPFAIALYGDANGNREYITQIRFNGRAIVIDKRWVIDQTEVTRRVSKSPINLPYDFLTFDLMNDRVREIGQARIDIQLNDDNYATVIFAQNREQFARFNGNYVINRYKLFINRTVRIEMQSIKMFQPDCHKFNLN